MVGLSALHASRRDLEHLLGAVTGALLHRLDLPPVTSLASRVTVCTHLVDRPWRHEAGTITLPAALPGDDGDHDDDCDDCDHGRDHGRQGVAAVGRRGRLAREGADVAAAVDEVLGTLATEILGTAAHGAVAWAVRTGGTIDLTDPAARPGPGGSAHDPGRDAGRDGVAEGGPNDRRAGAVQAAAQRAARSAGRAVVFPGQPLLLGDVPVADLVSGSAVDRVESSHGAYAPDAVVRTSGFLRPCFAGGQLLLRVGHDDPRLLVPWEVRNPTPCCADHA